MYLSSFCQKMLVSNVLFLKSTIVRVWEVSENKQNENSSYKNLQLENQIQKDEYFLFSTFELLLIFPYS